MKNKKSLVAIVLLIGVAFIATTIAFFNSTGVFDNIFKTKPYYAEFPTDVLVTENWLPGQTLDAVANVNNTTGINIAVRLSISEKWTTNTNTTLPNTYNDDSVVFINFTNTDDWTKKGDYYYYNKILAPNETTSNLFESVTLNPLITGSYNCEVNENGTTSCASTGTGYDNATYTLQVNIELIQSDAAFNVWGFEIGT